MNSDYLLETMYDYRESALHKLAHIIEYSHLEEFAKILSYAWGEDLPEAKKVTEKLNLLPIDFAAIEKNQEEFQNLLRMKIEEDMEYSLDLEERFDTYMEAYG